MRVLSLSPILLDQVPAYLDIPVMRLTSIIGAKPNRPAAIVRAKTILTTSFVSFLKHRFQPGSSPTPEDNPSVRVAQKQLNEWTEMTSALVGDRKSTRLNSSHQIISYAVFCLKKKKQALLQRQQRDP